jgi:uncharacterized membrane protein YhaH (DUF805 family)
MEVWNFLFSFRGRIARSEFWTLVVVCAAFLFVLAIGSQIRDETVKLILAFICIIGVIVTWLSAATRRLHDRGKSAWYLYPLFGVPSLLATFLSGDGQLKLVVFNGGTGSVLDLVSLAIGIWMIVELGCLPGTPGPNQFGPDPLSATELDLAGRVDAVTAGPVKRNDEQDH